MAHPLQRMENLSAGGLPFRLSEAHEGGTNRSEPPSSHSPKPNFGSNLGPVAAEHPAERYYTTQNQPKPGQCSVLACV
jgi:hypothetical protein